MLQQEAHDQAENERPNRRLEFEERKSIESVEKLRRRQQREEEERYHRRDEARRRQEETDIERLRQQQDRMAEQERLHQLRKYRRKDEATLSLEAMFEECISNATEVAKNLPKAAASELNTIIRRIDDIHFRLQIWGSEVGANAHRQFTFDDILKLKDSELPEIVQRILESFQQQFSTIGRILKKFLPRKTFDDLFQELRVAIDVIYGLVQDLVGLSNSLRMEQALQKNEGPYEDMRKEIQRTRDSFQDRTLPNNVKEELQSKNPVKESPDAWAKGYMLTFGQ